MTIPPRPSPSAAASASARRPLASSPGTSPSAPRPKRLTLDSVRTGKRETADKVLLIGTDGIGKSTWGASWPSPVFIASEDGLDELDVAQFPEPRTFGDVLDAIDTLTRDPHDYKTLVFDTLDWLEPLIWAETCRRNPEWRDKEGNPDIEAPGYGKGYAAALTEWRILLAALDTLRATRQMHVVLLAHATIRTFSNPAGPDFIRHEGKLQRSAYALVREWVKAVLFAMHEEFTSEAKGLVKAKGVSTGARVIYTRRTAAWDAKNRHGLPEALPLSFADYDAAKAAGATRSAAQIAKEIEDTLTQHADALGDEYARTVRAFADENKDNRARLEQALSRLLDKCDAVSKESK